MSCLTTEEQLLPIADEVFLHEPYFEQSDIVSSYRHARIYLRLIIDYAQRKPFQYKVSLRQLARIIGVSKAAFIRWFCHNDQLGYTSRRIFWFVRHVIWINCREARRARGAQNDSDEEDSIKWPTRRTMARWKRITKQIRDAYSNRGPVISDEREAEEVETMRVDIAEPANNRALNGNPDILTNQELIESFGNMVVDEHKREAVP